MAQISEELEVRTVVCFVLDGAKGQVRTLTNPHLVECYEEPKRPPIKSVVQRIDLSDHETGAKLRIRGIVTHDAIFGAEVVGDLIEDEAKVDTERSEEWEARAKQYTGEVRDRQFFVHGYNIEGPSVVYTQPEFPPVASVTQRLDLDLHEGKWLKVRAVFDRNDLWGAVFLGEVADPSETAKERVMDADDSIKVPQRASYKGRSGARRIVLGVNTSESSPLVFDYVLNKFTNPEDFMLVYVQIPEDESLDSKMLREKRKVEWIEAAKKQAVVCEVFASCLDVKASLPNEVERVGANTVVCGSQREAPADSIFNHNFADYCLKQCRQAVNGRPVRVRRINIPSERHLTQHHNYIMEDLEG